MRKLLTSASAAALALILLTPFVMAAPNTISHNGKLLRKDGTPLIGLQLLEFSICDQLTGGNCPWKEQRYVTFNNGVFSTQLGEVTPLPANIFENKALYLGISLFVSGNDWETFTPRQPLTAAPYAMNANDVLQRDISPRSISISGYGLVIDATGKWVGNPLGVQGSPGPQGPTGATGPAGPAGSPALISLVDEPAGANCANGGKKISVGVDSNNNNTLDAAEVTSNAFVCNGTGGTGGVASINKSPLTYGWTQTFGSLLSDDVKGLAIDAAGNLYVVGNYTGTFDGQQTFGLSDVFVRKYSSQGQLLWTKVFGGSANDRVTAIAVEPVSGGIYIGGAFSGTIYFDPDPTKKIVASNSQQPFLLHLDANGAFVWVKSFAATTSTGQGGITDIAIDQDLNIYYCGTYGSSLVKPPISINFNTDSFVTDIKTTQGYAHLFVTKLDKNGYYQWTYFAGQQGNYMAAARMKAKGTLLYVLGKDRQYNKIMLTTLNSSTGAKAGETIWTAANFPYLAPTGIAVDSTGSVIVSATGSMYTYGAQFGTTASADRNLLRYLLGGKTIFPSLPNSFTVIQKFDSLLNPSWTYSRGVFGSNGTYTVAVDASDNIYFGGEYTGDLITSESNLYDPRASAGGSTDMNLFKLNSAGKFQWAESSGGYGADRIQSILIDKGDMYLGGFFTGGFDSNFTQSSRQYISSKGAEDAYVSKFSGIVTP